MTRETYTYIDGYFDEYEVEYMYALGRCGTYYDPPEPHEVEVLEVYDTKRMVAVSDQELIEEIEEHLYEQLNDR